MNSPKTRTAIEKRADNPVALAAFDLEPLKQQLPLIFPHNPDLPPSPKGRYRSAYRYLGFDDQVDSEVWESYSSFEVAMQLFDYGRLERLLAAHIYVPSARGQVPFHPVSMYLLSLYRREHKLSRHQVLRVLRHPQDGQSLRRYLGFDQVFPSESGLRYFERQITPALQQEINAWQLDLLYEAGLLPCKPDTAHKVTLSFDGMLHEARSHMRCSNVQADCYQPAPRPCAARQKGKRGCDCDDDLCATMCRHATPRDPEARFVS